MKTLTKSESEALYSYLLASSDPRDVLLLLLFETGARVSEALALTPKNLVGATLTFDTLKNSLPREVLLSEALVRKLSALTSAKDTPWAAKAQGQGGGTNRQRDTLRRTLTRYFHDLTSSFFGRRVNLHALRHTAFTRLYTETKDLLLVKAFAGHRSINSTLVYLAVEKKSEAARAYLGAMQVLAATA